MNKRKWNQWTRYIFKTDEAKSKPWARLGLHPMAWASLKRDRFNLTLIVLEATRERQTAWRRIDSPVVFRTPTHVECVPYNRIAGTLAHNAERYGLLAVG